MSALASILIGSAVRVGAPVVKRLIEDNLGKTAGSVAETVIDAIAGEAGVTVDQLPSLPAEALDRAVATVEAETPELVAAYVAQQREANRLMLAEMDKGGAWTWAWRPATMWMIGALWLWSLVLVPLVNALSGATVPLFLGELTFLTGIYLGLYMGGHTAKEIAGKLKSR
jgi:hypothetical protein